MIQKIITALVVIGLIPATVCLFAIEANDGNLLMVNLAGLTWIILSAMWFKYKPLKFND